MCHASHVLQLLDECAGWLCGMKQEQIAVVTPLGSYFVLDFPFFLGTGVHTTFTF